MSESKRHEKIMIKLSKMFYLRGLLLCMTLIMVGAGISYITVESTLTDIETEVCNEREEITGYCLDSETITLEKFDPLLVGLLIAVLSFSAVMTYKRMSFEYKKTKYGFKSTWDDKQ